MHATILEVAAEQHGICYVDYNVSTCYSSIKTGTLVDCGATDGNAGFGLVHLETWERSADISGVYDDNQLSNFPFAGLLQYQHGFAVAIIPQEVSYHGKGALFSLVVTWELTRSVGLWWIHSS